MDMKNKVKVTFAAALFFFTICLPSLSFSAPEPSSPHKSILVLFSHQIGMPWDSLVDRGLNAAFSDSGRKGLELSFEYLDLSRNPSEGYEEIMLRMLEMKYAAKPPGIVISDLDQPGNRMLMAVSRLFPEARIFTATAGRLRMTARPFPTGLSAFITSRIFKPPIWPLSKRHCPV